MGEIVNFRFGADSSQVNQSLAIVRQNVDNLSEGIVKGFSVMGMDAVLGLFGKLRDVVGQLGQMFSSCMREAAALEEVGTRLGVMLNDAAAGDALASSLQRMATNGIVPLQELEKTAAALTQSLSDPGEIADWVGVFANISAGSDITADRLAKMTARLQDMGKAEFTELANAGIPIFTALAKVTGKTTEEIVKLSSQGKLSTSTLLEAFKELTAEGEKYHDLNATMSNTTGGSWDTLAASFAEIMAEVGESLNNEIRPILQWVSEILQEYKDALSVIIGLVMRIVAVWGGLKALAVAKQLWQCVAALTAMRSVATGVWGVFRSIGKVGWLLVITSAVEALTYLYDKFFGASGQAVMPQPVKTKPDDFIAQTREQEKREKEKRQRAALNAAAGVEDFNRILQEGGAPEDYDISEGRRQAAKREHEKAQKAAREKELEDLQRNEANRVNKNQADAFKKELDAFEKLHDWQQKQILGRRFGALRIKNNHDFDVSKMRNVLDTEMAAAAEAGNSLRWRMLQGMGEYVNAYESAGIRRQKEKAALYLGYQALGERESLLRARELGDEGAVRKLQATKDALELAQELESWGMSKSEARNRASSIITREYNLDALPGENQEQRATREYMADSLASIGGGGRGFSLGEAQLDVARRQVDVLISSREILVEMNKKMEYLDNGTIKVVP